MAPGVRAQMSRHGATMIMGYRNATVYYKPRQGARGTIGTGLAGQTFRGGYLRFGKGGIEEKRFWRRQELFGGVTMNISRGHASFSYAGGPLRITRQTAGGYRISFGGFGYGIYKSVVIGSPGGNRVKIRGVGQHEVFLDRFRVKLSRRSLPMVAEHVRARFKKYPPETEANEPKTQPGEIWYERLRGSFRVAGLPRFRTARRAGGFGSRVSRPGPGFLIPEHAWRDARGQQSGVKLIRPSERLAYSWKIKLSKTRARIGTKVSYSPFVHDSGHQLGLHGERGWPRGRDVLDELERRGIIYRAIAYSAKESCVESGGKLRHG